MKLPGSKLDVIRTKNVSGPSPVGGATGGTEGKEVWSLDEFELQAAYYNMACACAKLGEIEEVRVLHIKCGHINCWHNNVCCVNAMMLLRSIAPQLKRFDFVINYNI